MLKMVVVECGVGQYSLNQGAILRTDELLKDTEHEAFQKTTRRHRRRIDIGRCTQRDRR
jgi:hypothetical protein